MTMNWQLFNVLFLGVSFMAVFTAFQTTAMVQESVLEAAQNETGGDFHGAGYKSLAVIYIVFSAFNWIAPAVVALFGPKVSMIVCAVIYNLFTASFLFPMLWTLYTCSVLIGAAAAVLWTAQGNFLTLNSSAKTIGRNSALFWALFQSSLLWGNLYVFFTFKGVVSISHDDRWKLFLALTVVGCAGTALMIFFKPVVSNLGTSNINSNETKGVLSYFKRSFLILREKSMLLLILPFLYTGLELTFFSGVYGTMLGHTQLFGDFAKSLIGLSGICIGAGEITSGLLFSILSKRTLAFGRDPVVLLGMICHLAAFFLIFVNLPMDSPIQETSGSTYFLHANMYVALLCAFLLGFGDACFNTQIISILGFIYSKDSLSAFALFKFFQSFSAAAGFFYSPVLYLHWQLLILAVFCVLGTVTLFWCERSSRTTHQDDLSQISTQQLNFELTNDSDFADTSS